MSDPAVAAALRAAEARYEREYPGRHAPKHTRAWTAYIEAWRALSYASALAAASAAVTRAAEED